MISLTAFAILASAVAVGNCGEIWFGTSPFCDGDPRDCPVFDMEYVRSDKNGDGKYCLTGTKVLCRTKPLDKELQSTEPNKLAVVSYNVFERPFFITHDGQTERTCHITRALLNLLPQTDVIIFEEAFMGGCWYDSERVSLKAQLRARGFPYTTEIVGSRFNVRLAVINGGVFIASRHPIVRTDTMVFSDSGHADALSKKGVVYTKIVKNGTVYHVFGTHMQAQIGDNYDAIRVKQARELRQFVGALGIPASEPVIVGGDFNCDSINNPTHVGKVMSAMNVEVPPIGGDVDATYDPENNDVVEPGSELKEWLDFVTTSKDHKQPRSACLRAYRLQADEPMQYCNAAKLQPYYVWPWSVLCTSVKRTRHLSDHFPVLAEFEF